MSAMVLVGCAPKNSIDRLVTVFSQEKSLGGGESMAIALPASARPQLVVEKAIEEHHKVKGFLHKVLEVRENLNIKGRTYTAVLISTNTGQEIVLTRYDQLAAGWWWHVYPVTHAKF